MSILHSLDDFNFQRNYISTSSLIKVPLQANCSKFIDVVDLSFDNGATWMSSTAYDASSQSCSSGNGFSLTLSNSKSPWSTHTFTIGDLITIKFRAITKMGETVYRDVTVRYTPTSTLHQETLVGAQISSGSGMILKSRLRAQQQHVATGGAFKIRGRILE